MPISNTLQRFKYLAFITILCTISLSCFSQESIIFDTELLRSTLLEKLPIENRNLDSQQDIEDLYDDLQIAEIYTVSDLDTLIENQLPRVLAIEKEVCEQMREGEELTANVPNGTYSAEIEDVPQIREGIYFTVAGLVRTMIDLTHPKEFDTEEYDDEVEAMPGEDLIKEAPDTK